MHNVRVLNPGLTGRSTPGWRGIGLGSGGWDGGDDKNMERRLVERRITVFSKPSQLKTRTHVHKSRKTQNGFLANNLERTC